MSKASDAVPPWAVGLVSGLDDLQLLDDRAGPSVRDDDRQRILMFRTNVDEMNVESIDLGDELRQGVQPRFDLAPVVACRPIAGEFLHRRELYALRCIRYRFPLGPPGRFDTPSQFDELRFRHMQTKRTNGVLVAARRLCDFSDSLIRFRKSEPTQ